MAFLWKSYNEHSKVEKTVMVATSYEGLDDEEELQTVPIVSKINDKSYVFSGSNSNSDNYSNNENIFDEDIEDKVKVNPSPLSMPKWFEP